MIILHGGFEHETPNVPTGTMLKIDTSLLFKDFEYLLPKEKVNKVEVFERKKALIHIINHSVDRGNPLQNIFINHLLRPAE